MWINSLIAGAGGQIVDEDGNVKVDESAGRAAEVIKRWSPSKAAPPGMANNKEDQARLGLRVRALGLPGQLPLHLPERRREQGRGLPEEDRLGALPADRGGQARAGRRWAASTWAWAPTRRTRTWPSTRPRCLAQPANQVVASEKGGLPPTTEAAVRRPEGQEGLPVRRPAARVDRGRRAAPGQPGLQRHLAGDPEDLPPARRASSRTRSWTSSRTASTRRPKGRSSDAARPASPHRPPGPARPRRSASPTARARAPARLDAVRARGASRC